jgi:hypothetical protein
MQLTVISDIHGKWQSYATLLDNLGAGPSVQIGDFGWGYAGAMDPAPLDTAMRKGDHRFFRGNHDNPSACATHDLCLDDVTYDIFPGVFTLAGAFSIDRAWGIEGETYWSDEEMSPDAIGAAIELYEKVLPDVVLSHDAPEDIVSDLFPWFHKDFPSDTRAGLEMMRQIHKPKVHIFGHWHTYADTVIDGTRYICMPELHSLNIDLTTLDVTFNNKRLY